MAIVKGMSMWFLRKGGGVKRVQVRYEIERGDFKTADLWNPSNRSYIVLALVPSSVLLRSSETY